MTTETQNETATFPAFPGYICPGDYRRIECGPYSVTARIVDDLETRPDWFDCYDPEHVRAWSRGDWYFAGVVLSVHVGEYLLDDNAASLWGIDCNFPGGDNDHFREIANDLLPVALEQADKRRAELIEKLTA